MTALRLGSGRRAGRGLIRGPAAAAAAGAVPFSIGSDTSGSIMMPSAWTGITGLRPTYGRVSRAGAMTLSWSVDRLGPMLPEQTAAAEPASRPAARARTVMRERFVLTARTEVTDRMLIFGQRHLRTILAEFEAHYNGWRPHRSRQLRPPRPDHPVADPSKKRTNRRPVVGGPFNEYQRAE
jgi:hypothetical protein